MDLASPAVSGTSVHANGLIGPFHEEIEHKIVFVPCSPMTATATPASNNNFLQNGVAVVFRQQGL